MRNNWYPSNKEQLNNLLNQYLNKKTPKKRDVHGLIVPHAGYIYSGRVAGNAYSIIKNKEFERAIVLGPSHRLWFYGIAKLPFIKTPFGKIKAFNKNSFSEIDNLNYEHSVDNQIPFLQKLKIKKILPLVVGDLTTNDAKNVAERLSQLIDTKTLLVFSTDLSHFLPYENAKKTDQKTIQLILNLDSERVNELDACGKIPLLIMMYLCKLNNWKPQLIKYENSGDITGDRISVVGYSSFYF